MKQIYESPQIEVVNLELEDTVLAASGVVEDLGRGTLFGEDLWSNY